MSINNINNSGDGNIFNQNIGDKSIYDLFDIDDLAYEWCHRKMLSPRLVNHGLKVQF